MEVAISFHSEDGNISTSGEADSNEITIVSPKPSHLPSWVAKYFEFIIHVGNIHPFSRF